MTETPFFDKDLHEAEYYETAKIDDKIVLPVTRLGFEALLARALEVYSLPCDDSARQTLCGFVHHIEREIDHTTIQAVASAMRKQVSNLLTTVIWSELNAKIKAEKAANTPKLESVPPLASNEGST